MIRCYNDLVQLNTFEERFRYLQLNGSVGFDTFGFDRWMNQKFYGSKEWKIVRDKVIARDNACDLGLEGEDIYGRIYIHHMNPITPDEIHHGADNLFNIDFLICCTHDTHNAIHYGTEIKKKELIIRTPRDTILW